MLHPGHGRAKVRSSAGRAQRRRHLGRRRWGTSGHDGHRAGPATGMTLAAGRLARWLSRSMDGASGPRRGGPPARSDLRLRRGRRVFSLSGSPAVRSALAMSGRPGGRGVLAGPTQRVPALAARLAADGVLTGVAVAAQLGRGMDLLGAGVALLATFGLAVFAVANAAAKTTPEHPPGRTGPTPDAPSSDEPSSDDRSEPGEDRPQPVT